MKKRSRNPPTKILFLHGWHSIVGGVKPTYLQEQGYEVINPKLDDDDFELALQTAQQAFDEHKPNVIVGSSRGGAIAMNLVNTGTPLVLLCPAWKNWGNAKKVNVRTIILHSKHDDVIPCEDSVELLKSSDKEMAIVMEVGRDHRLADSDSLQTLSWACRVILDASDELWTDAEDEFEPDDLDDAMTSQEEGTYVCDACGEEIVIPLDLAEGSNQQYVEDCPVCCRANIIHVTFSEDGKPNVWSEPEQDRE